MVEMYQSIKFGFHLLDGLWENAFMENSRRWRRRLISRQAELKRGKHWIEFVKKVSKAMVN